MRPQRLWKMVLTAALGAALLLPAAAAEAANEADGGETPSYTLTQWGNSFPIQTWGQVVELGAESLTLENSQEDSSYQKLVINVNEDTLILDAVTGQSRTFSDIQQGETLYAWVGPAMTKSLPPITTARLLLCGLPADAAAPTYAEVQSVIQTEEGVDVCVTDQVVLHLSGETELLAAPGSETVSLADIVPGTRLLSWYETVALSFPAQAVPTRVMIFPSAYSGWVSAQGLTVSLNGQDLELTGAQAPRVEEGRLLVPVRPVAEALGCTVTWEPYTSQVVVSQEGAELYRFTIGQDQATMGDVTVGLVAPSRAEEGVTLMTMDDLIVLHSLKLESGS